MLDIQYYKNFIDKEESANLYGSIFNQVPWQEEYIKIFGNNIKCPRKVFWYGDIGINYKYSGVIHTTSGWIEIIKKLKDSIESFIDYQFNFVLLNYYANGHDYMGWHSDNEASLGINPIIASISLGANRVMLFKNKKNNDIHKLDLDHGSLLVMHGQTQKCWLHSIPKRKNILGPRINLTFRNIKNN